VSLAVALILLLVGVACSDSSSEPAPGAREEGSPQAQPDADELVAIEETVRGYLEAFRASDFAEMKELSANELEQLADWSALLTAANISSTREVEIDSLEVASVDETAATVDLEATFSETFADPLAGGEGDSYTTDLTGPVELVQEGGAWKVADFYRDGRSRLESIFTNVRGQQEKNGVAVEVVGVDLRPDTTVVVTEIRNTLDQSVDLDFDAAIVTRGGQQLGGGQPASQTEISPDARLEEAYYWANAILPVHTSELRLLLDFFSRESFEEISFDIPLRLID
jgi:hypothetical protein